MSLTRKFSETVQNRAKHDPAFKAALFEEALQALFDGDIDGARELLRDCINATVGFQAVSQRSGIPIKSVMRMVGPSGNPRLENFFNLVQTLQKETCTQASVHVFCQDNESFEAVLSSTSASNHPCGERQIAEAV